MSRRKLAFQTPTPSEAFPEIMNQAQAARYLGFSPQVVRELVAKNAIPSRRLDGIRRTVFSRSALDAWAAGK